MEYWKDGGFIFFRDPTEWDVFCNALDLKPKDIRTLRKLLLGPSIFDSQ
jgi:hypothetical protein